MLSTLKFSDRSNDEANASLRMVKQVIRRKLFGIDRKLIRQYLQDHPIKKLQIGCGFHQLAGWLNTDYLPVNYASLMLDATHAFPFASNTFDYIYSEHMIEHISFSDGLFMLSECFRILKPKGIIRIATPDFQFLIDMYTNQEQLLPIQENYLSWMNDWMNQRQEGTAPYAGSIFMINNFVRDWGHQFIYDQQSLSYAFEKAGFININRQILNYSEYEALRNLANETREPEGFLALESLVLEGQKPDNT